MQARELERLAAEIGIDAIGAAAAEPYDGTERHIRDRRARGLFADMRFTMAQPEVSCHPEKLVPNARMVVSAALCYYADEPERAPGQGRLPRYSWYDAYGELETTPALGLDCGSCTLCIEACPTGALDEPGTLDATKCLSYWTQSAHDLPDGYGEALQAQVYGCDICQDVCPWNRGVEKRRAGRPLPIGAEPHVDLVDWRESDPAELRERYARLYVPRNDGRFLQRNARIALANEQVPAR